MSTQRAGGRRCRRAPRRAQAAASAPRSARVGRHAADDRQGCAPAVVQERLGALDELLHDRRLIGGGQIGAHRGQIVAQLAHGAQERRLQAREREVVPGLPAQDVRKREPPRIAVARDELERGTAGLAQAEEARALVEGLAGGVVERAAETHGCGVVGHVEHERVPAGREQAGERRLQPQGREPQRGDVAKQVIDRDERQVPRVRDGLGRGETDEQRTDQARALA